MKLLGKGNWEKSYWIMSARPGGRALMRQMRTMKRLQRKTARQQQKLECHRGVWHQYAEPAETWDCDVWGEWSDMLDDIDDGFEVMPRPAGFVQFGFRKILALTHPFPDCVVADYLESQKSYHTGEPL